MHFDEQVLKELSRLAIADPVSEVRESAALALQKFSRKLQYFGRDVAPETLKEVGREQTLEETRAFIAHEVRSAIGPLRIVAHALDEALDSQVAGKEELKEYVQRILKQTNAAYEVVNQYLDYTKLLKPAFEPADINQLLTDRLDGFRQECEQRRIEIVRRLQPMSQAQLDRQMIAQVLQNVLQNAIDAMEKGGRLTIATQQDRERAIITISDTGPGLKPEHQHHVFELGFTTKLGKQGAGIGLALSHRLVHEAHHGRISIANNPDGIGATVKIELPIKQQEE